MVLLKTHHQQIDGMVFSFCRMLSQASNPPSHPDTIEPARHYWSSESQELQSIQNLVSQLARQLTLSESAFENMMIIEVPADTATANETIV